MLIASANLLKAHGGRGYTLRLYGQEAVADTAGVARMNLFMHNLTQFRVEVGDTLKDPRFKKPDGSVATFDVIVANPPYSLKWKPWTSDPRAIGGVAPQSSADWAFVQHMIASMDPKKGRVGVVLPHGVLFRGGQEAAIRQRVLDDDLLEAVIGLPPNLFYSTIHPDLHPGVPRPRHQGPGAQGRRAVHRRLQAVHQGQEPQHPHPGRHRRHRDRLPGGVRRRRATRRTPTGRAASLPASCP